MPGLTLADLEVIERLDPDTRAVVERYARAGGLRPIKDADMEEMQDELDRAEMAVHNALQLVRKLRHGGKG